MYVADILKAKGTRVVTISSAASIELVAQRLRMERIGALVVSETGATVDGIISERDVAHGLAELGGDVLSRRFDDQGNCDMLAHR
jgi:predicted transcriptional regulator